MPCSLLSLARGASLLLLLLLFPAVANAAACPKLTHDWGSVNDGDFSKATLTVTNQSPVTVSIRWVNWEGEDQNDFEPREVHPGGVTEIGSYTKHHFRVYGSTIDVNGKVLELLLLEHNIAQVEDAVTVQMCDELSDIVEAQKAKRRMIGEEMIPLVHDQQAACEPRDDSSQWSCINHIPKAEYEARLKEFGGIRYGFNSTEESGKERGIGATVDRVHEWAIPQIPRFSEGKGFLKMDFTKRLKELILPFYEDHKTGGRLDSEVVHRTIPGGFTNSHTITMSLIKLDDHPQLHREIIIEMQRILEWWMDRPLRSTATFGIRNYKRESMLINHVDREDTHIASAVIQVGQDVDEGWPLEVLYPDDVGGCDEVYLQPGQLVLYEGARFRHGRPMRFNGTSFANIFSHFAPLDWHGVGKSPNYDNKLDKDGFVVDSHDEL